MMPVSKTEIFPIPSNDDQTPETSLKFKQLKKEVSPQSIPHHIPSQVVITPQVTPVVQAPSKQLPVAAVTLRPVKISTLPAITSSSTVLGARIAAAKYLKAEVQKVFLAYTRIYNPRGAKDELPLSDYGMGSGDLFFYHKDWDMSGAPSTLIRTRYVTLPLAWTLF